jgi:hypothetical protein
VNTIVDQLLCLFTTLSLYGLLRHCLRGPAWGWYVVGWAAAGLGIITKGAAAWLAAAPGRALLVNQRAMDLCFASAEAQFVDAQWLLVRGAANPACIARGNLSAALFYQPLKTDREGESVPTYAARYPGSGKR